MIDLDLILEEVRENPPETFFIEGTEQEVLNRAYTFLVEQGMPAMSPSNGCQYRDGDMACAVGCLIPDRAFDPRMDQVGDTGVSEMLELKFLDLDRRIRHEFLRDLQKCHDESATKVCLSRGTALPTNSEEFLESFDRKVRNLCDKYNLDFPGSHTS